MLPHTIRIVDWGLENRRSRPKVDDTAAYGFFPSQKARQPSENEGQKGKHGKVLGKKFDSMERIRPVDNLHA